MARPNLSYLKNVSLFLFGLPLGLMTGLTGMGSRVFLIPGLRWLIGLRPPRASAVVLAVTGAAAVASLLSYSLHHDVRLALALILLLGQTIGAGGAASVITARPVIARQHFLWGLFVAAVGLALVAQGRGFLVWQPWLHPLAPWALWPLSLVLAVAVGAVSRVMGVEGLLLVPALVECLHLTPLTAQGTALLTLLLAALPGLFIHVRHHNVDTQASIWISVGAGLGALIGAYEVLHIHSIPFSITLYGIFLTVVGISSLWRQDGAASSVR